MTPNETEKGMMIKIWGASGSTPVGFHERKFFGGDTVCFELQANGPDSPSLILDLGTGARRLGAKIRAERDSLGNVHDYDVLLSHLHLDHVLGLPFFAALFTPGSKVRINCGVVADGPSLFKTLRAIASPPYCPIEPLDTERASFHAFRPDARFDMAGFDVTAIPLNHPGGCCGFRFKTVDGTIVVIGDHEHGDPNIDDSVLKFASGADLLLYDGCLDIGQYEARKGWGHSTWSKGVELARNAGIGAMLVYHHLPENTDDDLGRMEDAMRSQFQNAFFARQEMSISITKGKVAFQM